MLVSIFSPKGGVGKTTLTLAIASILAQNKKVCVIEFDFSPGDFPAILNITPNKNIITALSNLNEAIQKPESEKFDVIVGAYPDDYLRITSKKFVEMIGTLNKMYEFVLVDIQPGFIENCIDVMGASDKVLLIAEDDMRVAARVNGFLDWLTINNISDFKNYSFIRNKSTGKKLVYLSKLKYKLPVVYFVPLFKNFRGYRDKRLLKHVLKMREVVFNEPDKQN